MSPSATKRPKNRVVSKMQEEKQQDKTEQPASKTVERNRLKMVLRNLSILKLLRSSNRRIQELHSLARRDHDDCNTAKQNNEARQGTRLLEKKPERKRTQSSEERRETKPQEWRPKVVSEPRDKAREFHTTAPGKEKRPEPEVPRTSRGARPNTGARARKPHTWGRHVVFLKTYCRTHRGNMKQLDVAGQCTWFEGLPTRVHLPGPRVGCRASILRKAKRCCTRLCSSSLEQPMFRPYKVV